MNKTFQILIGFLVLALTESITIAAENELDNPTYIIGHWNYPSNSVNPVYVISDGEDVELFINGISNGKGRHESKYLFTFDNIVFQPGTLTAVSYDKEGKEKNRYSLITSGVPAQLKLTVLEPSPLNQKDNPEEEVIQCEITDFYGKRCLSDNRMVFFEIEEPADWVRTTSQSQEKNVYSKQLSLNKGENRISIRKPKKSGEIKVTAKAAGLAPTSVTL